MPVVVHNDKAELFRQAFADFPAVSSVEVNNIRDEYTIDISVRDFDRSIREPIYQRQRELIRQFSDVSLVFHVLDESPETAPNAAIAG